MVELYDERFSSDIIFKEFRKDSLSTSKIKKKGLTNHVNLKCTNCILLYSNLFAFVDSNLLFKTTVITEIKGLFFLLFLKLPLRLFPPVIFFWLIFLQILRY